jgi:hypothetical protein
MYDQLNSCHGGFTAWKETNDLEAGWAPEPVLTFRGRKSPLPLPGFDPRTVQPVASRCTD